MRRTGSGDREPSHSQNSRINVVFPMPASPMTVTRRGRPSSTTRGTPVGAPRALLAADEGVPHPARHAWSHQRQRADETATGDAAGFPLAGLSPARRTRRHPALPRRCARRPGSRPACGLLEPCCTLTASPVTNELLRAACPRRRRRCSRRYAARAHRRTAPRAFSASRARCAGALRVILLSCRRAEGRHDGVADELFDRSARSAISVAIAS